MLSILLKVTLYLFVKMIRLTIFLVVISHNVYFEFCGYKIAVFHAYQNIYFTRLILVAVPTTITIASQIN